MEQVTQFVAGERDYTVIKGGTGPLVYPAAHVYVYTGLYHLTEKGTNILLAQQLFGALYMATLAVVMLCYWRAGVPPYVFPVLVLSKRLHSIFVLRCFNDGVAVFFLWLAIFAWQRRQWSVGALVYSFGLGVKMSLLLALPAVGVMLFLARGFKGSLRLAWLMAQLQIVLAVPFLSTNWRGYLARAFELSRQFKYEWTVNWRMLGEERFLSKELALGLLGLHAGVLLIFVAARWLRPAGYSLPTLLSSFAAFKSPLTPAEELTASRKVTPEYVTTSVLSAMLIGMLCARSLHYQFYAYLAWASPYLLWRSMPHPVFALPLLAVQEWAWNVFPSTDASSTAVVNVMAATVLVVYFGTAETEADVEAKKKAKAAKTK